MNTHPHRMNDNTLIQLLKSDKSDDNNKVLSYIITNKQNNVTSKLRVPTHIDADEMFNNALYQLWKYVKKSDFDTSKDGAIERFLYVVCQRYIWRNSGKESPSPDELPELFEYMIIPSTTYEQRRELRKLFDRLGAGCQQILTYRFFDDMSHKEIAEAINSTDGSVRARYSQCLKKLKQWIAQDDNLAKHIRDLLN